MKLRRNNSGIILITVLWAVVILTVFTLSARGVISAETAFIENRLGKARAYETALAGIDYALDLLDRYPSDADSLWQCGVQKEYLKDAKFNITFIDEARRLNINAITEFNKDILSRLIQKAGYSSDGAKDIAIATIERTKNDRPFDVPEELQMVPGMTKDIYLKIKDDITVYPQQAMEGLKVNLWTASDRLFNVLMEDLAEKKTVEDPSHVRDLAEEYRHNPRPVTMGGIERAVLAAANHTFTSSYYRIRSVGKDDNSNVTVVIDAYVTKGPDRAWFVERWVRE